MTLDARRDDRSPSTRWSHGGHEDNIHEPVKWLLLRLPIIPASMIQELSEELEWRLSTIFLLLWHIEIINEDDELLANGRTIDAFSPLLKLFIEVVLGLIG